MSFGTGLGSILGGATGTGLAKNVALSKVGEAGQAAIQGANAEAEVEITAAQLLRIKQDTDSKVMGQDAEARKGRLETNAKAAGTITF